LLESDCGVFRVDFVERADIAGDDVLGKGFHGRKSLWCQVPDVAL